MRPDYAGHLREIRMNILQQLLRPWKNFQRLFKKLQQLLEVFP